MTDPAHSGLRDNQRLQTTIAVVVAIVLPSLVTWIYFVLLEGRSALVGGLGKAIQFALPAWWVFVWLRLSWREAGLPTTAGQPPLWSWRLNLLVGFCLGVAIVLAMFGYYGLAIADGAFEQLATEIESRVAKLSLTSLWGYAALGIFYSCVHSCLEEYYFRWFVFGRLRSLISFSPAAVISGLAFMAHHVIVLYAFFGLSLHTLFLSLCIAVGGWLWAWQYERSHSLLGPWLSHLLVDAGIFLLGYHMLFVVLPGRVV